MATLPSGVTLQQIDGVNYYSSHGLTYAVNAGWDNPNFFPIGPWLDMLITQSDATRWHDLDWNTAFAITGNSSTSVARSNGISVIQQSGFLPGTGAETVGLLTADEPSTFADGVSTPISTTANSIQDGRFWYINNTWNFIEYGGLNPVNSSTQVLETQVTTPNGTQRHIDASSIDIYWFAGAHAANPVLHQGGLLDNLGRDMTPDEAARGSNYGDMITQEIAFTNGAQPVYAFIEDGGPYTEDTSSSDYITPPELNWAVWSSLIHGARGVIYFNHTFAGPAQSNDNLAQTFYQTIQPGQTISMYNQVKATDALVAQMAPVLNSPIASGYVTVSPAPTLFNGIETAVHYYNGTFYIFSDTRVSETQHNIPAVFTLNDPNATSVTVVNENLTIPVVNGSFSDTFANASTVHIYQVNDGAAPPPPPGPPAAPVIANFSPDTAPVGDGHTTATSITLTGKGEANSTVNVLDGKTVGHASVDASGAWSLLDSGLTVGAHSFTATDTDANGTSAASAAYVVTIDAPTAPPPGGNLVTNGGFETGDFTGWTESGNVAPLSYGPQLFITSSAHSGQDAAAFGPVGSDGTISQNLTTVIGQSYTLDFWLANATGGTNDFTAKIGGVTELHLANAAAQPYTHYNFSFTATSTSTTLEFDFRQDLSEWHLDDVSVVQVSGNLVTNGGFETGDFTGWTDSGNVAHTSYGPQLFITSSAHSGQYAVGFGSVGSDGTISQNLTTVVGHSYTLDFWLANAAGGANDFTAKIGGVTELHLVNAAGQPYTHYTYDFTATSTSTPLEFDFRQDPSHWQLDDVSVVQVTGIAHSSLP